MNRHQYPGRYGWIDKALEGPQVINGRQLELFYQLLHAFFHLYKIMLWFKVAKDITYITTNMI